MIPDQLKKPELRFCLLKPQSKTPFEKNWPEENYKFNAQKLLNHLKDGGNYGVIGGFGKLRILDIDDKKLIPGIEEKLNTFAVTTGGGGRHFYLFSDYNINHVLRGGSGELRSSNYQVVGPGCIHPNGKAYVIVNDVPIMEISEKELKVLLEPYLRSEVVGNTESPPNGVDTTRSGREFAEVCRLIRKGLTKGEVFRRMKAFAKWTTAPQQYRELTYKKASAAVENDAPKFVNERLFSFINSADLRYETKHLSNFEDVKDTLMLNGQKYDVLKKIFWYQLISIPCREKIVRLGGIETDLRVHVAYVLGTGLGKKQFINVLGDVANFLNVDFQSPTVYHPENLVGKKVKRKEQIGETNGRPKYRYILKDNFGWFNADVLVLEEASNLFKISDPKMEESRRLFCNATDTVGRNLVTKGGVDVLAEERLAYTPRFVASVFTQTYPISGDLFTSGFIRRFFVPFVQFPVKINPEEFIQKIDGYDYSTYNEAIQSLGGYLGKIAELVDTDNFEITFTKEATDALLDYHLQLLIQVVKHSHKTKPLVQNLKYHLQNKLVQLSSLQAISRLRSIVAPADVKLAFMDLTEVLHHYLEYIDRLVYGLLPQTSRWVGSSIEDSMCLEWLESRKSAVELNDFKSKIEEFCGIKERAARNRLYQYIKRGWVQRHHKFQKWEVEVLKIHTGSPSKNISAKKTGREIAKLHSGNTGNTDVYMKMKNKSKYYEIVKNYSDLLVSIATNVSMDENALKPQNKRGFEKVKTASMENFQKELAELHKFIGEKIPKPELTRFPKNIVNKWKADGTIAEFGDYFMIVM